MKNKYPSQFDINLRPEVLAFAVLMERRLRENDAKKAASWKHMQRSDLIVHAIEKAHLVYKERIDIRHPVDLANYCMMIADVSGALVEAPTVG